MTTADRAPDLTHEPPPPTKRVLITGLVGVGLALVALLMGLLTSAPLRGFDTHWADGPRALLCVVGLLVAGCAVSLRPGWFGGWLCGAATALLGYGFGAPAPAGTEWYLAPPRNWYSGVPNSWDSVQLFFGVACVIGLVGAIWTVTPNFLKAVADQFGEGLLRRFFSWLAPRATYALILFGVAYHFAGILSAITSPPPTPWLTDQYWKRVARPYLQFAYMNNAYQFYSPDPGPACELWVCVEYRPLRPGEEPNAPVDASEFKELELGDDPDTPRDCEWHYIPKREVDYKDPLGLSFYRRLSVTENVAQYVPPGHVPLRAEQEKVAARRAQVARTDFIPRTYPDDNLEHRVPNELVVRQVLPSYVRHMAHIYAKPDKAIKSIRVYRTLHMIATLAEFRGYDVLGRRDVTPKSPYNPGLYLPYFQGKFARDGRLIDPTDPMLYWLVPISPVPGRVVPHDREEQRRQGGYSYYFTDYVSKHAGCDRPIKE